MVVVVLVIRIVKRGKMLPLNLTKIGENVSIAKVSALESERKHLLDMGFVEGADIFVVSNNGGDIICYLKESRLGVTKNVAKNIMVNIKRTSNK
ncbi:MAG: ferrous iron transport protein A [Lachnospiraceae bacterium]|nr:ferrous iron transport protein A [Lachnospiraceae bacterium]